MKKQIGIGTLWVALAMALAMLIGTMACMPALKLEGDFGICLPSPNLWNISLPLSWIINTLIVVGVAPILLFFNKKFNFVQGGGVALPAAFLVLICGNPLITRYFCASTLLLAFNAIALWMLSETYEKRNATQDYFVIATLISIGSMLQYAFLPMIVVYIVGGVFLKSLRIKETIAFIFGLAAPYWIGIGMGIIAPQDFHLPHFVNIFCYLGQTSDMAAMLISTGLIFLACTILSLNNAVHLYAGNSKIRRINNVINTLGYVSALCMVVDFNNLTTYVGSLYVWMAVQVGNLFALHRVQRPYLLLWILTAVYVVQYFLIIR